MVSHTPMDPHFLGSDLLLGKMFPANSCNKGAELAQEYNKGPKIIIMGYIELVQPLLNLTHYSCTMYSTYGCGLLNVNSFHLHD